MTSSVSEASSEAAEAGNGAGARLYIDLDVCSAARCATCDVRCSYFHHPGNNGVRSIAELATYHAVCRRCEYPHCVSACPRDALEQRESEDKLLERHSMRCIACASCSHACPYGTIYPEHVPLLAHRCDYCLDRRGRGNEPLCTLTCPHGALSLAPGTSSAPDERTYLVGRHLMVHATHWEHARA